MIIHGKGLPILRAYDASRVLKIEHQITSIPAQNHYAPIPIENEQENVLGDIVTVNKGYRQVGEIVWPDISADDLNALMSVQAYQGQDKTRITIQPRDDDAKVFDFKFVEPIKPRHDGDRLGNPAVVSLSWMQVNVSTTCDDITII